MSKEIKPDEQGFYSMRDIRATTLLGKLESDFRNVLESYNKLHYEQILICKRSFESLKQLLNRIWQKEKPPKW